VEECCWLAKGKRKTQVHKANPGHRSNSPLFNFPLFNFPFLNFPFLNFPFLNFPFLNFLVQFSVVGPFFKDPLPKFSPDLRIKFRRANLGVSALNSGVGLHGIRRRWR
jgi:hypothetical protein